MLQSEGPANEGKGLKRSEPVQNEKLTATLMPHIREEDEEAKRYDLNILDMRFEMRLDQICCI